MWSQFLKLSPGKKLVYATGGSLGVGIATMSITELLAGNSQQVELERRQLQAREQAARGARGVRRRGGLLRRRGLGTGGVGEKRKTGGRRWRGLGWRAIAGLWSRCASATGRAGSTASTC